MNLSTGNELNEIERLDGLVRKEKGDLAFWADVAMVIEKVRVAAQVRISHLAKTGRRSPDTEMFLEHVRGVEKWVDATLASYILNHPTWPWASRVKGIGKENFPKVIGLIEAFGRYYDVDDPEMPPFVTRPVEDYQVLVDGDPVDKEGIWVDGIERLATPSKLHKYAGEHVIDGRAPKREAGTKLGFNSDLRVALVRLATALNRAGSGPTEKAPHRTTGIWYTGGDRGEGYGRGYQGHRLVITSMKEVAGFKIVPTPRSRMCLTCNIEVVKKAALWCPDCGDKLTLKEEPPGILFKGHLHQMSLRQNIKDFTTCVWVVWRQALGLPCPPPYNVARLGEPPIDPWKMVDRPATQYPRPLDRAETIADSEVEEEE